MQNEVDLELSYGPVNILFMGTYPPRDCGIATFTRDLASSIEKKFFPSIKSKILAVNEKDSDFYDYPEEVIHKINEKDIQDYVEIAKKINEDNDINFVCIQHEYGIFGGEYGSYLIEFLKRVKKPIIVTLHTVKDNPDEKRKKVTQEIAKYSDAIVVLINLSKNLLERKYEIDADKIYVIPHGIHHVDFIHPPTEKKFFNTNGKVILSTFGLLGAKTKGLDYTINALADLVKDYPNLVYAIIGTVHPNVIKEHTNCMESLKKRVKELGLENNVIFIEEYLELDELLNSLIETDIYLTPFVEKDRKSSGTLSYAMGCGRICISTPFYFAEDLIEDNDDGILVEFEDSKGFVDAIRKVLEDPKFKKEMEQKAYKKTRPMVWESVAEDYLKLYEKINEK